MRGGVGLVVVLASMGTVGGTCQKQVDVPDARLLRVLVMSKTAGFRHDSIPAGIDAIKALGAEHGFGVDATEDASAFTTARLDRYAVVVFLNTTGDILDTKQEAALKSFIQRGGGFVGVHAASDTEHDWPWYGGLVAARFTGHPAVQVATIEVIDRAHRSTRHLPNRWQRRDEWYNFAPPVADGIHVLARLDESTYSGGTMGRHHRIVWCHDYDGGRAWYTGGGHTPESYQEPLFIRHLLEGILWAAGAKCAGR